MLGLRFVGDGDFQWVRFCPDVVSRCGVTSGVNLRWD
jgi:hypothetical protein